MCSLYRVQNPAPLLIQTLTTRRLAVTYTCTYPCSPRLPPHCHLSPIRPGSAMPRRALLTVVTLLALLHTYIGFRLIPAMALGPQASLSAFVLLVSTLLMPAGLFGSA